MILICPYNKASIIQPAFYFGFGLAVLSGIIQQSYAQSDLAGNIVVEGSSTLEPILMKAKDEFNKNHPQVNVSVSGKGTGNGLAALIKGETDIADASRPIKQKEHDDCRKAGIEFYEIPVAYDGLSIVVNRSNTFVKRLTVEQLTKIFREDQAAKTWDEIDSSWPREPISIYAAGIASGTHDYFVEVIGGEKKKGLRSDEKTTLSEDDKMLVRGIKKDLNSIGFFGYAYYLPEAESLRAVEIVNEKGDAVAPTAETIANGTYSPFSRPLFIYVNAESYRRAEVKEFVDSLLLEGKSIVEKAGYIPLPKEIYDLGLDRLEGVRSKEVGSYFLDSSGKRRSGSLREIYEKKENLIK